MKPKFGVILDQAIEEGVKRGYRKAFKYIEDPTEESICQHIEEQVMSSLHEYFEFDEELPND